MCVAYQVIMYFRETVAISMIYYNCLLLRNQSQNRIIGMFTNNEYFNKNQMWRRNEFLEGCHGQTELLPIIVWTRQKHSTQCYSPEFNNLLYKGIKNALL